MWHVYEFRGSIHPPLQLHFRRWNTEPEFVKVWGAQESIPRNRIRQPMEPGGPVRHSYLDRFLGLLKLLQIRAQYVWETEWLLESVAFVLLTRPVCYYLKLIIHLQFVRYYKKVYKLVAHWIDTDIRRSIPFQWVLQSKKKNLNIFLSLSWAYPLNSLIDPLEHLTHF